MQVSRSIKVLGGVMLAAVVIGFTNPKAVHAVTAALVQVTNTASNPVVTQSTDHQPAQILDLQCASNNSPCYAISSTTDNFNGASSPFQVPAGKSFVVTAVDITALPTTPQCSNSRTFYVMSALNGTETNFSRWWITPNQNYHFAYPTGIVFASGSYLYIEDFDTGCYAPQLGYYDAVFMQGYLTNN